MVDKQAVETESMAAAQAHDETPTVLSWEGLSADVLGLLTADASAGVAAAPTGAVALMNAETLSEVAIPIAFAGATDNQWHLSTNSGYDINVLPVWADYTGAGVTVGVVDDGIQANHPELAGNYDASIDYDFVAGTSNVTQYVTHGTSVAGCIAAANDGTGTTGVAYGATITSFKLLGGSGIYLSQVQGALSQNVDVSNNSWGWTQPFAAHGFTSGIESTLQSAVTNNRGGLGTVFVFSAGNSGAEADNANYSEMLNSRFTIGVGATNQDGTLTSFSTPGAPVLVSAPGAAVYTTDVTGSGGYASGNYASMYGTSFSAPITSAVVALMLEANSSLGYRDVQEILAYSAIKTDAGDPGWATNGATNWNGGGMHVNDGLGYGLIDATAAVRLAETWLITGNSAHVFSNEANITVSSGAMNQVVDNNTIQNVLNISGAIDIDHVEVVLSFSHNYVPQLQIELVSPDGTSSVLFDHPPASNSYGSVITTYQSNWSLSSTHHWGEVGTGNWTLRITDSAAGNAGTLTGWTLKLWGDTASADDTYVYTNEFASFTAGGDAARRTLSDASGTDTINAAAVTGNSIINLNAGQDSTIAGNTVHINNGTQIENAIGGDGNDVITGNSAANTLVGGRGNDTLDGGGGIDTLIGGKGDDIYYVDSLSDVIIEYANEGHDIVYSSIANYVLSANVEELHIVGGGLSVTGTDSSETMQGNGNANILNGMGGDDVLYGRYGDDTLLGGLGNDFMDGGEGRDIMDGGDGDDTYVVDHNFDQVIEGANEGTDTVLSYISYALADNIERLRLQGTLDLNGSGNTADNAMYGNSGVNLLDGKAGNDYLDGGAGADTMIGGYGNDTYVVDNVGDDVQEVSSAGGVDTVQSSITYTLGANLENLRLLGSDAINGTGNSLNNNIYGNSADNILDGGAGNDYLDGGAGTNTLIGGLGNDTYIVNSINDTITENAGEGTDTVMSYVTYTLSSALENLRLQGSGNINATGNGSDNYLTGNSGANVLTGLGGNDTLDGGAGADTMIGGLGNDIYFVDNVGDVVTENSGEGTDIIYASVSYTIADNVESLRLLGSGNINATGNADANTLTGNNGNNILTGGDGNDILDGGLGVDTLIGGTGDDWYIIRNSSDVITENSGEGNDYAFTYVDYTLGANVERLRMQGNSHINATGNAENNQLYGNVGNNTLTGMGGNDYLDGGAGADTMIGGMGDDVYVVDSSLDVVTENAGEGNDTVLAYANHTLSANVETLRLQGAANLNATGNSAANVIYGNAGDNIIDGRGGNDVLLGLGGNDTFTFGLGCGSDLIQDFQNGLDHLDISGWGLSGFGDLTIAMAGADTTITFAGASGGEMITLDNIDSAVIDASDFIFA
ncbi:MAG: S8 family serine peptidase [Candidatus Melainabacteria bacterium]